MIEPWGTIYGVGVFSDPFTLTEYLIVAADGNVYCTCPNNAPFQLALPAGTTITSPVEFTQAFDVMVLHQGPDLPTLVMPRVADGFSLVQQTHSGDGTDTIPNATRSLFFQNRLFIPKPNDEIAVSDYGDYTRYVPVAQEFKINVGSADNVVNLAKFNDTTLVVFKQHSIYVVNNVYGNLEAAQQDEITNQFGLVAPKSIAHVGNDLWFLSELGVMSLTQTQQNKLQGKTLPESEPIQPLIDRINWRYAANSQAAYWDSKYYLAVPLDDAEVLGGELALGNIFSTAGIITVPGLTPGATYRWQIGAFDTSLTNGTQTLTASADFVAQGASVTINGPIAFPETGSLMLVRKGVNNAVLVYDFLNGAWSGYDQSAGLAVQQFFPFTYNSQRRLFMANIDGWINLYEEGVADELNEPYVDLAVVGLPVVGVDTLQVNGGTLITAAAGLNTPAGNWQCLSQSTATAALFADTSNNGGFAPASVNPWSAPDTRVLVTLDASGGRTGIRIYGTNGVLPTVTTTGVWATTVEVNEQEIESSITTRGYSSPQLDLARFNWCNVDVQTWNPTYTLSLLGVGVSQQSDFTSDQTRDRTLYYNPADAAAFDTSNVNNDFATAHRQDYSLLLGPAGASAFDLQSASGGVRLGLHQEHRHTERINLSGRAAQVKLVNTTGRIRLMAARLEGDAQPLYAGDSN